MPWRLKSKHSVKARYIHCDVTDMTAIVQTVADAEEAFGPLDILVNNAAIALPPVPITEMMRQIS